MYHVILRGRLQMRKDVNIYQVNLADEKKKYAKDLLGYLP